MNKETWIQLGKGDIIKRKVSGSESVVVATRRTKGGSYVVTLETGAVYYTGDRRHFI